jgi:hypothetical protein
MCLEATIACRGKPAFPNILVSFLPVTTLWTRRMRQSCNCECSLKEYATLSGNGEFYLLKHKVISSVKIQSTSRKNNSPPSSGYGYACYLLHSDFLLSSFFDTEEASKELCVCKDVSKCCLLHAEALVQAHPQNLYVQTMKMSGDEPV